MQKNTSLIPLGHPNRPGFKLEALKAIVTHYTQNESPNMTDTAHVSWVGRKYFKKGTTIYEKDEKTPFRFGSAHVFCDMDSSTLIIPTDEVTYAVGDKNNGGYKPIAHTIFKTRQNYQTVNVEICNNDVIKNSDEDWGLAVENAKTWICEFLEEKKLKVDVKGSLNPQQAISIASGSVLLLRHFDLTGKMCPAPLVIDQDAWTAYVQDVAKKVA